MQAQAETYNGWTNFETWGVALVIDNDAGSYEYVRERLTEIHSESPNMRQVEEGIWGEMEAIRYTFADFLKDYTEELCGFGGELGLAEPSMMASQLLRGALSDVNFDEIATNIISE